MIAFEACVVSFHSSMSRVCEGGWGDAREGGVMRGWGDVREGGVMRGRVG